MEMGDNDNGDGDGFSVGVLFSGFGLSVTLVILAIFLVVTWYSSNQRQEQRREFCTSVCADHGDAPVIQGTQCYCRGDDGTYDPGAKTGGVR